MDNQQDILTFFPLENARDSQKIVLQEIVKAFSSGKRIIILEAPVGSGKSAIAVTLAKAYSSRPDVSKKDLEQSNGAHIITPRKNLQDQYYSDFSNELVLMKGRNAYPCTYDIPPRGYVSIVKAIREGKIKQPDKNTPNCAEAPCKDDTEVYKICTEDRDCPYVVAISLAQEEQIVVHNLHSFIYQSNFSGKFNKRDILIIDEAHEIESTIRDFVTKKITVPGIIPESKYGNLKTLNNWHEFLLTPEFIPVETDRDRNLKSQDKTYVSARESYLKKVEDLFEKDYLLPGFSVQVSPNYKPGTHIQTSTSFEFIPHYVGNACNSLLFSYGEKLVLMSGTIYNKDLFCKNLGLSSNDAYFIRIGSTFPKSNRPIYFKSDYTVNTAHAVWNDNFPKLIDIISQILSKFNDVKGLIHAPSYLAATHIRNALNNDRIVIHDQFDFQTKLENFFASNEAKVFLSPICQQGVDFKDDRARFQIIVRIPYPSTSSKFIEDKVKNDFPWYNYQTLVTFGQQIGRINRSDKDFGATFLIDERFGKFLQRNSKLLPTWVKEAVIWR